MQDISPDRRPTRIPQSTPRTHLGRLLTLAATLTAFLTTFAVTQAQATVVAHGTFAGSETGVADELCGIALVRDTTFSGDFRIRLDKPSNGQAFFQRLNLQSRDAFTNPLNGRSLTFEGSSLINELHATQVAGNVYQFTTIEAGQPFTVRDASGTVVLRDRGVVRHHVLFDTLGDGTPGGFTIDDTIVAVGGPHPGLAQSDAEFCAMVQGLIG